MNTNKGAIIVAIIGAIATIVSAVISVGLRRENVVLINSNADLESRLARLEQSQNSTAENYQDIIDGLQSEIDSLKNQTQSASSFDSSEYGRSTTTSNASDSLAVYSLLAGTELKDYGTITDNYGYLHDHAISKKERRWSSAFVDLDWQYSRLTGVFFQNGYYSKIPDNSILTISALNSDGNYVTLWQGEVNGNTEPLTFDIDVSGRRKLDFLIQCAVAKEQPPAFFEAYLWK